MDRRSFLSSAAGLGMAWVAQAGPGDPPASDASDRSPGRDPLAIIRSTLVVDGYEGRIATGAMEPDAADEAYVRRLRQAGLGCLAGTRTHPDLVTARSVGDIRRIHAAGRIAQVYHADAHNLGDAHLKVYGTDRLPVAEHHARGLRILGIAYNLANVYGGGCLDPDVPLTRAGRRLVEEAHRHRILLDVGGHNGERTSLDAIAMAPEIPVVNTHGNVRALNDNPRCNSDRLIEAIARTGGVVGLSAFSDFMARNPSNAHLPSTPQVGMDTYLDQFDYVKRLVGVDHIGIAADNVCDGGGRCPLPQFRQNRLVMAPEAYGEEWTYVKGFESVTGLPNVVQGLIRRGWSTGEIRKVLGGNWLRVYEQAWGG